MDSRIDILGRNPESRNKIHLKTIKRPIHTKFKSFPGVQPPDIPHMLNYIEGPWNSYYRNMCLIYFPTIQLLTKWFITRDKTNIYKDNIFVQLPLSNFKTQKCYKCVQICFIPSPVTCTCIPLFTQTLPLFRNIFLCVIQYIVIYLSCRSMILYEFHVHHKRKYNIIYNNNIY